jgi:RNA polymerase sigma factor (sigma-70 family)
MLVSAFQASPETICKIRPLARRGRLVDGFSSHSQEWFETRLTQARAGSRKAFEQITLPFRVLLRMRAREHLERRLQGKVSDSDLFQITSLKAFESLGEFRGSTSEEFGSWLLSIMDHTALAQSRMYHRPTRDVAREISIEKVRKRLAMRQSAREEEERSSLVNFVLSKLPDQYRTIIQWRFYENLSYEVIGDRLTVSPDAARHLCHRAIKKLGAEARKLEREW